MKKKPIRLLLAFSSKRFNSWHNRAAFLLWVSSFASIIVLWILNPKLIFPIEVLIYYFLILALFNFLLKREFHILNRFTGNGFLKKIFIDTVLYCMLFVIIQYIITIIYAPKFWPFELSAVDSIKYNYQGKQIAASLRTFDLPRINSSLSDIGYPYYLGFIFTIIGSYTLPIRILNCVWVGLTVVYLSKTLFILRQEDIAKLSGILIMLLPSFGWMAGMQLKESLMIFLVVYCFYNTIYLTNYGISLRRISLLVLSILLLFFFRTFLGLLVIVTCFTTFYIISYKNFWRNAIVLFLVLPFLLFFIVRIGIISEIRNTQSNFESTESGAYFERGAKRFKRNTSFINVNALTAASIIMPLSNFYDLDSKDEPETIRVCYRAPNEFIKNSLLFFFFIGIWLALKKWRIFYPFAVFIILYSIIISSTGAVLNYRYQLVILPFICIFMAQGIIYASQNIRRYFNYWFIYMVILVLAHIMYNLSRINFRT